MHRHVELRAGPTLLRLRLRAGAIHSGPSLADRRVAPVVVGRYDLMVLEPYHVAQLTQAIDHRAIEVVMRDVDRRDSSRRRDAEDRLGDLLIDDAER